jgi:hypothetical protein
LVGLVVAGLLRAAEVKVGREVVMLLLGIGTLANLVSLALLTHYLVTGGHARAPNLISGGVIIWSTNLLLFAVWFWVLDRGGPPQAGAALAKWPDLLFPQMSDKEFAAPGWKPGFVDYLYVSLTNQSAFSPTDTMPLTIRMKILMGVQGLAGLVTVGIIVARAVNILA